jgi:3-dehydroquinate synthase
MSVGFGGVRGGCVDRSAHNTTSADEDNALTNGGGRDDDVAISLCHRLRFTHDAFDPGNATLRDVLANHDDTDAPSRCLVCIDTGVLDVTPDLYERIHAYARAHSETMSVVGDLIELPGGERSKTEHRHYERIVRAINDHGICRHSYVIAIGGGAVLDAVGFAASISHRGVRLVRFPTTTLAQDDSGVGVKNGVNAFGKKNFLGAFSVPWAVINDDAFLRTLADRDWRAGFSEAVKVALLKDTKLFEVIERDAARIADRQSDVAAPVIRRSAELHLEHIVSFGDPYELNEARPLDFGHWAAHKLEQMTDFRLRHGEAVAIGMALDLTYAATMELLPWADRDRVLRVLRTLGFTLYDPALHDVEMLLRGLDEFREHLGGELTVPLISAIGRPMDVHEIDHDTMRRAVDTLSDGESHWATPIAG